MERVIYRISLDVSRSGIQRTIQGIETGDAYAREVRITLRNGKENYELPIDDSIVAKMKVVRPDGTTDLHECEILENGEIACVIEPGDVSQVGTVIMQLELTDTITTHTQLLVAPRFALEVWESEIVPPSSSIPSFSLLDNAIRQARAYYNVRFKRIEVDDDNIVHVILYNGTGETDLTFDDLNKITGKIGEMETTVEELSEDVTAAVKEVEEVSESVKNKVDETTFNTELNKKVNKLYPQTTGTGRHTGNYDFYGEVFCNEIKYADYGINGYIPIDGGGDDLTPVQAKDVGVEIAKLRKSVGNNELHILDNTDAIEKNTSDIAQNTADIEDLKNRPSGGGASLTLTSASPLHTSTASNIIGIDAKGNSEQSTTQNLATVQGSMPSTAIGGKINAQVDSTNQTRCCTDVIKLPPNTTLRITSGYEIFTMYSTSADGDIVANSGGWETSKTVGADGYYRFQIRKADNGNLTPSAFTLTAIGLAPTPISPIPIVDASGEVVAISKNLLDVSQITDKRIILDNGSINTNDSACASDFIKLESGQYTFASKKVSNDGTVYIRVHAYDASKNWMRMIFKSASAYTASGEYVATFTMPTDAKYIRICWYRDNADSQLEIGTSATSYVPYASNTITLPYTLKSVGEVKDKLIVNEDGSGQLKRNAISKSFNGAENWTTRTTASGWKLYELDNAFSGASTSHPSGSALVISNQYSANVNLDSNNTIRILNGGKITLRDDSVADLATFKSRMASSNLVVSCDLSAPIFKDLTAEEVASIRQLMTYKGTTIIDSEMQIDSVTYAGDVKGYVDSKTDYSYTDQIIGKWADGKDLHRMVIQTTTPSALNSSVAVCDMIKSTTHSVKRLDGMIDAAPYQDTINMYLSGSYHIATFIQREGIMMNVSADLYANKPCEIIVEYTLNEESGIALLSEGEVVADE